MHSRMEAGTSTELNLSATSAPTIPSPGTPSHSVSSQCLSSRDSSYYYLAAAVLLLTALAVVSLTPKPGCTIIITGHSTIIQGQCNLRPELVLAAHPRGLSLELFSKFQDILHHGTQPSPLS
uniref:Movement protein TGBp3 n=1 Tax=Plantago asiatica mosaic potexvirus TaxID=28354 RepID=A0A2S1TJB0_P1AMV|nr:triple gene block protein3 [Plantago asiatica mosaic virus]